MSREIVFAISASGIAAVVTGALHGLGYRDKAYGRRCGVMVGVLMFICSILFTVVLPLLAPAIGGGG